MMMTMVDDGDDDEDTYLFHTMDYFDDDYHTA